MTDPSASLSAEATPARWFVYVVRCRNGALYTGIATDVERRLAEHESSAGRGARYLRGKDPLELVLVRLAGSRQTALRVEHRVKKLSRDRKEALVTQAHLLDTIIEEEADRMASA